MNKKGPIVVIEDDLDDQRLLTDIFTDLAHPNEIVFFADGELALAYICQTDVLPFLILSDINMPKLDGFALRNLICHDSQLNKKCIPYLFFSTSAEKQAVTKAYDMSVQGYFVKPVAYSDLLDTIKTIIHYWQKSYSPSNFA